MKTLGSTAGRKRKSQSLESLQQKSSGTEATGRDESSFSTEENLSPIAPNICLPTVEGWKCPRCEMAVVAREPAPAVSQTLGLHLSLPHLSSLSVTPAPHPECLLEAEFGWHTDSGSAS